MKLIPHSDRKRVYALFSVLPSLLFYLMIRAYTHLAHYPALGDVVLVLSVIGIAASLTVIFTKLKIAWWLRRKRFAFSRTLTVAATLLFGFAAFVLIVIT